MAFDYKVLYQTTPVSDWKPVFDNNKTFVKKSDAIREAEAFSVNNPEILTVGVFPYNELPSHKLGT